MDGYYPLDTDHTLFDIVWPRTRELCTPTRTPTIRYNCSSRTGYLSGWDTGQGQPHSLTAFGGRNTRFFSVIRVYYPGAVPCFPPVTVESEQCAQIRIPPNLCGPTKTDIRVWDADDSRRVRRDWRARASRRAAQAFSHRFGCELTCKCCQ